jgi:hypothetical protein
MIFSISNSVEVLLDVTGIEPVPPCLGSSRIARPRPIKLTPGPPVEFRSHGILAKAVGILVLAGTGETSSQMLQIIEIADLLLLQSRMSVSNGVPIGETAAT